MTEHDQEQWFFEQLEAGNPDTGRLLEFLEHAARDRNGPHVLEWAELLQEELRERGRVDEALDVLYFRGAHDPETADANTRYRDDLSNLLGNHPDARALLEGSGFHQRLPLRECLRRFQVLRRLKPGTPCHDKTWGFGIVDHMDSLYGKVIIDFEKRKEHEMTLHYAAETLEILGEDHLMVRRHRDPDSLRALAKDDPAELVRLTIRSFGPMPVVPLQERLTPEPVPEDGWKRFWDAARKVLKNDPGFRIPSRRSEPLEMGDADELFGDAWFSRLSEETNMMRILEQLDELSEHIPGGAAAPPPADDPEGLSDARKAIISDRLAFVIKGAGMKRADLTARAVIKAEEFGLVSEADSSRENPSGEGDAVSSSRSGSGLNQSLFLSHIETFFVPETFLHTVRLLPARDVRRFIRFLINRDRDRSLGMMVELVPRLEITPLNETMTTLVESNREEACAEVFREQLKNRIAGVEMLNWLSRNTDRIELWSLPPRLELLEQIIMALEMDCSGEQLKAQKQLRARFDQNEWLEDMMKDMDAARREAFFRRVKESSAWPPMEKRSVLGRMIKLRPELEELMKAPAGAADTKPKGPMTSYRSYGERQRQLEKIKKVDIPQNSKEIAIARSYGDLRENHEFKAAKEMQGLLMRRMEELIKMLDRVVATDFESMPVDRAGMGTGVVLEYPDGRRERFYILGVWDRDEKLGIISSESRMAQALEGHEAGEEVVVPTEHGETRARIVEILELPPEVREWIVEEVD